LRWTIFIKLDNLIINFEVKFLKILFTEFIYFIECLLYKTHMNNCAMFSSHKNSFFKLLQAWMLAWVKFCNDKIKLSIIFYIYILILILIIIHLLQSIFSMLGSSPLNHLTISWTNEQVILLINPFLPLIFVVKVYLLFLQITWMSEQTILLIDFFLSSMLLLKKTGSNRFFIVSWKFCSAAWKFP